MIFCDMDGVLVDFNNSIKKLFGVYPTEMPRQEMWQKVIETKDYWLNLPQLPEAKQLVSYLQPHGFKILTGLPVYGYEKAEKEKPLWIKKHFGADIEVICCLTKDKKNYCHQGDVLIDDRETTIKEWQKVGGIGIFHTSVAETISQLKKYGY